MIMMIMMTTNNKIISSYLLVSTLSTVGPFFMATSSAGSLKPQKKEEITLTTKECYWNVNTIADTIT
jgi:hypothetical protein